MQPRRKIFGDGEVSKCTVIRLKISEAYCVLCSPNLHFLADYEAAECGNIRRFYWAGRSPLRSKLPPHIERPHSATNHPDLQAAASWGHQLRADLPESAGRRNQDVLFHPQSNPRQI